MELMHDLNAIGFTEYEAKVYLALLQDHPATGYQLSKQAGIPRSMVYEALGRLDARGAVLKTEEPKATLYRPIPPDALLARLTEEHDRRISVLRHGLNTLYNAQDEGHLWSLTGHNTILSYAKDMLAHAQKEAMLVLTDENLDELREIIHEAHARGVIIGTLLTGNGTLEVGDVAHHPPRESQLHKLAGSMVVVVDEQEVLIASAQATNYTATVTTNVNMVQIGRQFVWMELFAHHIFSKLPSTALERLSPEDRDTLRSVAHNFAADTESD